MRAYRQAAGQLPQPWAAQLLQIPVEEMDRITEIRLRSGCPVAVTQNGNSLFLTCEGGLTAEPAPTLMYVTHRELQECFLYLCRYSVFAYENQLRRGYFTLQGGHRVGIAAPAVWDGERLCQPKSISSMVIRIAREIPLQQPERWRSLMRESMSGLLLAGPPGSGKTTVLRGLAGLLSDMGRRVAVVDERYELFPPDANGFGFARPWNCDVLSGLPKALAMEQALRTLSPQVVLCDELGNDEADELVKSLNSGIGFAASIHAASRKELMSKPQMRQLQRVSAVRHVVFLKAEAPGVPEDVLYVDG